MKNFYRGDGGYRLFNLQGIVIPATGTVDLAGVYEAAKGLEVCYPVLLQSFELAGSDGRYAAWASVVPGEADTVELGLCGYEHRLQITSGDKVGWKA